MITFSDQQISSFSDEEREMLNDLAKRHNVQIIDEEREQVKARIAAFIQKEEDERNYAEKIKSQFDTAGHQPTTQYY